MCLVSSRMCVITGKELEEAARQQEKERQLLLREKQEREQARRRRFEEQLRAMMKIKEQVDGMCLLPLL